MKELLSHIRHLLYASGSVAVDGVGVFMLSHRCASFSGDAVLNAPFLTVAFTAADAAGTDELVRSYMRVHGSSAGEARASVESALAQLRAELESGRSVSIDNVGTLACDPATGLAVLKPDEFRLMTALSLEPIETKPETAGATASAEDIDELWIQERRRNLMRAVRRTASSAAVIAGLVVVAFFAAHMPGGHERNRQMAGFGVETTAVEPVEPLIAVPGADKPALVLVLNTPSDGVSPARVRRSEAATAPEESAPGPYCLVVASLGSQTEADKYISAHTTADMPLHLLQGDGHWRVYALSAGTAAEAQQAGRSHGVYEAYPNAWVCRR